jgi:hypothetical protein
MKMPNQTTTSSPRSLENPTNSPHAPQRSFRGVGTRIWPPPVRIRRARLPDAARRELDDAVRPARPASDPHGRQWLRKPWSCRICRSRSWRLRRWQTRLSDRAYFLRAGRTVHRASLDEHGRDDVVAAVGIYQQVVEQIAPSGTVPQMVVRIDNRQFWLDDRLLAPAGRRRWSKLSEWMRPRAPVSRQVGLRG